MTLIILLFAAHYLADFTPLSRPYMLQAKAIGRPILPIFDHAFVHALLMGFIIKYFGYSAQVIGTCALLELVSHFAIDLLKGYVNYKFPSVRLPHNLWYWPIFGFDQFLHSVIIILIAEICNVV